MRKSVQKLVILSSIMTAGMFTTGFAPANVSANVAPQIASVKALSAASTTKTTTTYSVGSQTAKWEGTALKVGTTYPTGWKTVTTTVKTTKDGKTTTKTSSAKYYFVTNGKKNQYITNEFHSGYWIGSNGKADTSLKYDWSLAKNGKDYLYRASSSVYVKDKAVKITGKIYAFDKYGFMKTNCWIKYQGEYYYLNQNGIPKKNAWVQDKSDWYYVQSDGTMVTGLQTINNRQYYFNGSGVLQMNKLLTINNSKYWADDNGRLTKMELYKRYTSFPNANYSGRLNNYAYTYNGIKETAYSNYEKGQYYSSAGVGYRTCSYCGAGGLNSTYGFHVADDGTIRDKDGFIVVATTTKRYELQKVVMTSMGPGRYYDTSGGSLIDIYTHWQ